MSKVFRHEWLWETKILYSGVCLTLTCWRLVADADQESESAEEEVQRELIAPGEACEQYAGPSGCSSECRSKMCAPACAMS